MAKALKVVIIGGVAAGPKTGSRINRLCPNAEITLVEKGEFLSYAGCGLPYYISGVVPEQDELMSTGAGVVRDVDFFQKIKNIRVLNRTEALSIDPKRKQVAVKNLNDGETQFLDYDKLVIATGSRPTFPPIEGIKLKNIFTLQQVEDAESIKSLLAGGKVKNVVVVGGGLIGIEMTETLTDKGCQVTLVEKLPQILSLLDWEMAQLVTAHLEAKGVQVKTATAVESFQGTDIVESVRTDKGDIPCDMVIFAIGVRPNVVLAKEAGLDLGALGGIKVDEVMRTSDPDIYAVGDCVESLNRITQKPCYVPLGSTANKQGRVAASHICGIVDRFPGVLGSAICKVFDFAVGRTGLGEAQAKAEGFDVITVLTPAPDKAHYYPEAKTLMLKLIVDKASRKVLGLQAVGPGSADKRIDVAATAISANMTVDDVSHLDLCYAPPYSPAMDNIITAADIARNKLDGLFDSVTPMEVKRKQDAGEDFVFLDVRSQMEYEQVSLAGTICIPLGVLRTRLNELPKDKEIITFCKISLRGYEAARILGANGFTRVKVMDGGVAMWPYDKQ